VPFPIPTAYSSVGAGLHLLFHPLRFTFVAREPLHFPRGKSANILRGAFGSIFRKIACLPDCPGPASCESATTCPYARMCEPKAEAGSPSGLNDMPRPFVFRAWHLDGLTIQANATFPLDLNLFDTQTPAIAYLVLTFAQLAREGLGPSRAKVELTDVSQLSLTEQACRQIYEEQQLSLTTPPPVELDLTPTSQPVSELTVRFVTPTELKAGSALASKPEFAILAGRLRDRISTLAQIYGSGPLPNRLQSFRRASAPDSDDSRGPAADRHRPQEYPHRPNSLLRGLHWRSHLSGRAA
jgi:hypothetical protein